MTIAVAVDGRIVWAEGFGFAGLEQCVPASPSTKFRIGSRFKTIDRNSSTPLRRKASRLGCTRSALCGQLSRRGITADHGAGTSHEYVRDGSLPRWHGFHGFRRGLASTLYGLGVDDLMIQQILRHQDVTVTRKHYIKTTGEQTVSAMAKLEAALCADRALATVPVKSTLPN